MSWEVQPPVTGAPSGFGQVEVPQVRVVDGRPVLVFTCHPEEQSDARKAEHGLWCTWSVAGEPGGSLLGPWDLSRAVPFRAEPTLFAAPLVQAPRRRLGAGRVPQPGAGGDPLLRDHRPGAGARRGRRPAGPLTLWKPLRYWIARSDLRVTDNHPMSESCPVRTTRGPRMSDRLSATDLIDLVLDDGSFTSWDTPPVRGPLSEEYAAELAAAQEKTGLDESVISGEGRMRGRRVAVVACEFRFLAGSIGVDSAERLTRGRRAGHRRAAAAAGRAGLRRHPDAGGHASPSCRWSRSPRRSRRTRRPGCPTSSTCGTPPPAA